MTILDLIELLRAEQIFDISTVSFAVLETGGNLSVLLKAKDQPATAADVLAKNKKAELPLPVISDGKILTESLTALNLQKEYVYNRIKAKGLKLSGILLMTLDSCGNENIVEKEIKT